jgi:hypothetical protein
MEIPDKVPPRLAVTRTLAAGLGNGVLLLGILVWPIWRITQHDLSFFGGFFVLVWLAAGSTLFIILACRFCAQVRINNALLTPVFTLLSYVFLIFLLLHQLEDSQLLVVCTSAIALGVIVAIANEAITRMTSNRILNFVCFFLLAGMIVLFVASFDRHQKDGEETAWRQAVSGLDFPLYLPRQYNIQDPYIGTNAFSDTSSIVFGHKQVNFSESKYMGQLPPEDCGEAFGKEVDTVLYRCQHIHTGKNFLLFMQTTTYSHPEANTGPNKRYFAIFDSQTVVWYGNILSYYNATDEPVEEVIHFYDTLTPISSNSVQMKQLTESDGILEKTN